MQAPKVLVLGIGNLLWADEGFGVRAIDALHAKYECPDNVTLMDGGTQGLYLVPYVQECDILVVFDAVDYGLAPGTIKLVHNEDVPKFMGAKKMSLHQTGFQEVLATAELLGDYPDKVFLIGVQPEELEDYGGSLRDITKAQIQPCLDIAIDYLSDLGVNLITREIPSENANNKKLNVNSFENDADMRNQFADYNHTHHALNNHQPHAGYYAVNHPSLTIEEYEQSRPSAQSACRVGDERVLLDSNIRFEPKTFEESPESLSPNMAVKLGQRLKG